MIEFSLVNCSFKQILTCKTTQAFFMLVQLIFIFFHPSLFSVIVQYPVSLRLNRQYSETLSQHEARDTDMLRREVEDNVSAYYCVMIPKKTTTKKQVLAHEWSCLTAYVSVFFLNSSMTCSCRSLAHRECKRLVSGEKQLSMTHKNLRLVGKFF